jgi:hypothetical protein
MQITIFFIYDISDIQVDLLELTNILLGATFKAMQQFWRSVADLDHLDPTFTLIPLRILLYEDQKLSYLTSTSQVLVLGNGSIFLPSEVVLVKSFEKLPKIFHENTSY